MKGYRALELGGSASLSAVCCHIKLARAGDLHDAIEDAWLRTCVTPHRPISRPTRPAHIRRSVTEPGRLLPCRYTPYCSLPWTAGEPREDCILPEGVHEVVVAVEAFFGPE